MDPIRVLFLCTGNSARSVIAEALLADLGGSDFDVHSAGTHPKGINPLTVKVLQQAGLDPAPYRSKSMDEYLDQDFDYVLTVCDDAAESCPYSPATRSASTGASSTPLPLKARTPSSSPPSATRSLKCAGASKPSSLTPGTEAPGARP